MKYSVGAVKINGDVIGKAFETKPEAEDYLLEIMSKAELKKARIRNILIGEEDIII